jgi:hypothetical protein
MESLLLPIVDFRTMDFSSDIMVMDSDSDSGIQLESSETLESPDSTQNSTEIRSTRVQDSPWRRLRNQRDLELEQVWDRVHGRFREIQRRLCSASTLIIKGTLDAKDIKDIKELNAELLDLWSMPEIHEIPGCAESLKILGDLVSAVSVQVEVHGVQGQGQVQGQVQEDSDSIVDAGVDFKAKRIALEHLSSTFGDSLTFEAFIAIARDF